MPDLAQNAGDAAGTPQLIRGGRLVEDETRLYEPGEGGAVLPPDEPGWMVRLAAWAAGREALDRRRHPVAVLIAPDDDPAVLAQPDGRIPAGAAAFLAVEFPAYTDGRGYSIAQLLRQRHGWQGELRAVGDVMIDTIHYQARCGFDSFLVKPGHDPHQALAAFDTFSVHYQRAYPRPAPPVGVDRP